MWYGLKYVAANLYTVVHDSGLSFGLKYQRLHKHFTDIYAYEQCMALNYITIGIKN